MTPNWNTSGDFPPTPRCVFMTDDPCDIIRFAADGASSGSALVTIVETTGGAARMVGAQMAVHADGGYCGFVSGGCVEAVVATEAVDAITRGRDRILTLGVGSPFIDIVLPCGGGIKLTIHVVREEERLREIVRSISSRQPVGLRYDPAGQSVATIAGRGENGWEIQHFTRFFRPKLRIVVCGDGGDAKALLNLASAASVEIMHVDAFRSHLEYELDKETAIVFLNHDVDKDENYFQLALSSPAFYIGALGSQTTHLKRLERLRRLGHTEVDLDRVKGPIGLFKAKNWTGLAASVFGEIVKSFGDEPA